MPIPSRRLLTRTLTAAALLLTGAATHEAVETQTANAGGKATARPTVLLTLKDRRGTTYASGHGNMLRGHRFRITARLHRPVNNGAFVLRFVVRDRRGRRTGGLVYDLRARRR